MHNENLVLIDIGLFCEGMYISAGIYYYFKDEYVLLCKNTNFTAELITKLRWVAERQGGLYVYDSDYGEVWNESLRQYSDEALKYKRAYNKIKAEYQKILSDMVNLLANLTFGDDVPLNIADNISMTLSKKITDTQPSLLLNCINMIYQADNYIYTHCVNVATLNGMIGRWLGLSENEIKRVIKIGLVHDLGKLKVPPKILNKPGKLTDDEFVEIKKHPVFSYNILVKSGETDTKVLDGVKHHHEKTNGKGYPDGLIGEEISIYARITAVSDVYDAMVSKRCYKSAFSPFEVLAQFQQSKFSDLDNDIVNIFLKNIIYLLIGMRVKLSNGREAEVVYIREDNFAYPIVKVGNDIITTNLNCKCITDENDSI